MADETRSAASELRLVLARRTCRKRGHIVPVKKWGIARRTYLCGRCGAPVQAQIDWDGHP